MNKSMEIEKVERDKFTYFMLILNFIVSSCGMVLFLTNKNDTTIDGQFLMSTGLTYFIAGLIIVIVFAIVFPFKYEYVYKHIELTNEIPQNIQDLNKQQYVLVNPIRGQSIIYYDENNEKQMIELNDDVDVNLEESNKNEIVLLIKKNYGLFKKINFDKAEVIVQATIYIKDNKNVINVINSKIL